MKFIKLVIILFLFGSNENHSSYELQIVDCDPNTTAAHAHPINLNTGKISFEQNKTNSPKNIGILNLSGESYYFFEEDKPSDLDSSMKHTIITYKMVLPDTIFKDSIPLDKEYCVFYNYNQPNTINNINLLSIPGRGPHGCIPSPSLKYSGGNYSISHFKISNDYWIRLITIEHIGGNAHVEYFVTKDSIKINEINTFINENKGKIEIGLENKPIISTGGLMIQKSMILYHEKLKCLKIEA